MYALDTNSLIYFFKGTGRVAERLLRVPLRLPPWHECLGYKSSAGQAGLKKRAPV
jgi:hypothetical protein